MTIGFKIALIVLLALPVIAFAVYFYTQMLSFIRERNAVEKARIESGDVGRTATALSEAEKRRADSRREEKKKNDKIAERKVEAKREAGKSKKGARR